MEKHIEERLPLIAVSRNQPAGWQVANFVVSSRLLFARIFIFNGKLKVPFRKVSRL